MTEPSGTAVADNGKPIESVWDFPRPPRLERVEWRIRVIHAGHTVVDAPWAFRVLETSQPPAYYVDPAHVDGEVLQPSNHGTFCEWKGMASYVDLVVDGARVPDAGWFYREPSAAFAPLRDHLAFYAQKADRCLVDDEEVASNEGAFYGGWITANVTGPFKGAPGTGHW
ncbi:MAG: DUF427 domain-containing protein [Actinomycetota bacterium]